MNKLRFGIIIAVLLLVLGFMNWDMMIVQALGAGSRDVPSDLPPRDTPIPPSTPTTIPDPSPTPEPGKPPLPGISDFLSNQVEPALPTLGQFQFEVQGNRSDARTGDQIIFTIQLWNVGTTNANNVEVLGLIPPPLKILRVESTVGIARINESQNRAKIYLGVVNPGESIIVTIWAGVKDGAIPGEICFTAARLRQGDQFGFEQEFSNWVGVRILKE